MPTPTCPSCGGSGGGPFGPPLSAWDSDDYLCPRCEGAGFVREAPPRPGLVKADAAPPVPRRRASGEGS